MKFGLSVPDNSTAGPSILLVNPAQRITKVKKVEHLPEIAFFGLKTQKTMVSCKVYRYLTDLVHWKDQNPGTTMYCSVAFPGLFAECLRCFLLTADRLLLGR